MFNKNSSIKFTLIIIAVILIGLAIIFRWTNNGWTNIVNSDGKGYFAYLPAFVTWNDFHYSYFFNGSSKLPLDYTSNFLYTIHDEYVNKYPPGVAVLLLPFYLLATIFTVLFGLDNTGYSFFFQLSVSIGAIAYSIMGLCFTSKIMNHFLLNKNIQIITLISICFATNLTIYTIHEPSMSHVYSFAMVSLFLYSFMNWYFTGVRRYLYVTAIALGLIVLIRSVNVVVVFSVLLFLRNSDDFKFLFKRIKNNYAGIFLALALFLAVVFIQPLVWFIQNGHWYNWTYIGESFNWNDPQFLNVLFSYKKGWFVYTPFMLILPIALFYLAISRNYLLFFSNLFFWILLLFIVSSWWCWYYGGSFGQRVFIDYYPVVVLSATPLLIRIRQLATIRIYGLLASLCVFLNLIQSYQYKFNILHWDAMNSEKYWKVFLRTGGDYEWLVFKNPNFDIPKEIENRLLQSYNLDFEACNDQWASCRFDYSNGALSGNNVCKLTKDAPYSPTLKVKGSILSEVKQIHFYYWTKGELKPGDLESVYSFDDSSGSTTYREGISDQKVLKRSGDWCQYYMMININRDFIQTNGVSNIYLYGLKEHEIEIDDLVVFYTR